MKIGNVWVKREINEEYHTNGKVGYLEHHLLHYPFKKGFSAWMQKHNMYSSMEAELSLSNNLKGFKWHHILSRDETKRRQYLKRLLYKLPCRPLIIFLVLYFGP